ncbi:hypothetical protein QBC37DRAFT_448732 [Rhypophila decipiens]|uniref:Uncharacterized protein n=1 Tax=Rhypophila decipiens TaxID=261697 RepID=A0AAN7B443_9PEZI|nr:hypothetical protein QBC37DRAFT_448732 [Rhypophila decipiens]
MPQGPGLGEQGFAATNRNTLAVENTTRSNKDIFGNGIHKHKSHKQNPREQNSHEQNSHKHEAHKVHHKHNFHKHKPRKSPKSDEPHQHPARPYLIHPSLQDRDDTEPDLYYGESSDDEDGMKIKREVKGEPSGGN